MKTPHDIFDTSVINTIRTSIESTKGSEVFVVCPPAGNGLILDAHVFVRGDLKVSPVVMHAIEQGSVVIHNHPRGNLIPSEGDLEVAAQLSAYGVGFYLVDNAVSKVHRVVEPYQRAEVKKISTQRIDEVFSLKGPLAKMIPHFESRKSQLNMSQNVKDALNQDQIHLIEASTGIGKSFSYLVPSIIWACENKERIVIATNTIHLQEQLHTKDIPSLKKALGMNFKSVILKGRGNYVCLWKCEQMKKNSFYWEGAPDADQYLSIFEWTAVTKDGSKSDLNILPASSVWDRVKCDADMCSGSQCSFYQDCFLVKARRQAGSSDILIVNHHLLFADLEFRSSKGALNDVALFPSYNRVIIDEAHNLEDVATQLYSEALDRGRFLKTLRRLCSHDAKEKGQGLLAYFFDSLSVWFRKKDALEFAHDVNLTKSRILKKGKSLMKSIEQNFDVLEEAITEYFLPDHERTLLITGSVREKEQWDEAVTRPLTNIIENTRSFLKELLGIFYTIESQLDDQKAFLDERVMIQSFMAQLETCGNLAEHFLCTDDDNWIHWMEKITREDTVLIRMIRSPLSVSKILKKRLFNQFSSIVLTSATLTVGKKFDYFRERLGLGNDSEHEIKESLFESEFDFEKQVVFSVPSDLPPPQHADFLDKAGHLARCLCEITRGRTLILFTSYRMLNEFCDYLRPFLEDREIQVLRQGDQPRQKLLERFKNEQPAVLFGTNSFWEGIDVIGSALTSVILAKLPFYVPTDPVIQARQQLMEAQGIDPFTRYALPMAVIKFRQGFGRLIRSRKDYGIVTCLDTRVLSKRYGKTFLASLPKCRCLITHQERLIEEARAHFCNKESTRQP